VENLLAIVDRDLADAAVQVLGYESVGTPSDLDAHMVSSA
jgi:hypothetical protein